MMKNLLFISLTFLFSAEASAETIWNKKENFAGEARHRTSGFTIGNIGYMGLGHYNSGPLGNVLFEDFWAYDPATDSWTQVADFGGGLRYHCMDWVFDNIAYVGTGRDPSSNLRTDIWSYNAISNSWSYETDLPSWPRRGAVSFVLDDYGFIGCGQLQGGPSFTGKDFYAYHFPTGIWYSIPDLPGPERTSSTAFVIDNKGYVGTGQTSAGAGLDFYEYKPTTNSWTQKADVGTIPRVEAWGFSLLGKGYILCGASWSSGWNYSDMYEYDVTTDTWTQLPDFPGLGRRYLDGFEINDRAYLTLGTNGTNLKDLWEFDPANAVSIVEAELEILTYPNPATDFLNIELIQSARAELLDERGKLITNLSLGAGTTTIDVSEYPKGIYILRTQQDDKLKTTKIIVQ
jgi:N-acetylneuraminic acid mutarotase